MSDNAPLTVSDAVKPGLLTGAKYRSDVLTAYIWLL